MKQCKPCDVMILRPDNTPTPDDACTRCYEEVEALEVYMKNKKRTNKPPFREKLNSFLKDALTRLQDTAIFLSLCFVLIVAFPVVVVEALIKKRSVKGVIKE